MNRFRHLLRPLLFGMMSSLLLIVCFFLWCAAQVVHYSQTPKHIKQADVVIVLGAAAWGNKPSPVFRERINHALTLYQSRQVDKIIFTGGTPKAGYTTEAEVARRYAIKQGVSADDIYWETTSKDTYQNLVNARQIMRKHHLQHAILVSDPFHMARARAMAHDLGINTQLSPTPTSRFTFATPYARHRFFVEESYALFTYWILSFGNKILKMLPF
ncbi:MAG: YdcF family protein [Alysiella sp.]|uniref:YdcF family protein n=1 Tax=Alysiella sp. TaxID=1872483 RepID=UPI0026DD7D62|nr:YdcF family protein [Alysiella sp.]MDO4434052.1 YdcF family protein [Alysiella sp.]